MSGIEDSHKIKTIIWFSWKDSDHPKAGGAEVISSSIMKWLVAEGNNVVLFTSRPKGLPAFEGKDGYSVYRQGNAITCYPLCVLKYLRGKMNADLIVEEVNTVPFFISLFTSKPTVLFFHQLCKEVWFYQLPRTVGAFGFLLEKIWLFLLSGKSAVPMSNSTRHDLQKHGFQKISSPVIEGVEITPREAFNKTTFKGRILSFGSIRPMKRTIEQLEAFELAADKCPTLTLDVFGSGSGSYFERFMNCLEISRHKDKITYRGHMAEGQKASTLQLFDILLMTSVKEGWGLTITEAATQGVTTIAYDADGLRDAVKDGVSGVICKDNSPREMASEIVKLAQDSKSIKTLAYNAWEYSFENNLDNTNKSFKQALFELGIFTNE
ncbi:glycosyltransferase family 4 protein [Candidatus Puniceispirillum marinum]|uniref:Glycosyl transferase, group 1 n=1 Tax=Puniceispirillum marinum (strain IMCC1322) TaxID=488538 RepID=D5BSI7_PUNMI|nr:glycosyltransferase family 4 protein [Candidatus Puniceispirillum marinum]ADE39234.1 glycosyl transferase, group 1 [Candidatus Puniceispirillum marinum IMCC1322]